MCIVTIMSGALDKSEFAGKFNLLRMSEENIRNKYVYTGGDMISSSLTNDDNYKRISNMGNK